MSMDVARKQVANGVALLDEKVPGWWRAVKLETLNMHDCTQCMLGQLFGYDTEVALGAKMFGLPVDAAKARWSEGNFMQGLLSENSTHEDRLASHGFTRGLESLELFENPTDKGTSIGCNIGYEASFNELKCAWAEVIAERRALAELAAEATAAAPQHNPQPTGEVNEQAEVRGNIR